ncbi:1,4-alpha-glucan branching protein GlgB [Actinomycetota bacterium]
MAEIHSGASLTPSKVELVQGWLGDQRWYAAKGRQPRLRRLGSWRLDDPLGEVGIETLLLADESGDTPVVYQVPLTYRAEPLPDGERGLVGTMEHSVLGTRYVYDAPHDPVYVERLLALIQGRAQAMAGSVSETADETVAGGRHPGWQGGLRLRDSRVLTGEQSNTSVIADTVDDDGTERPVIVKVFRTLQAGDNPDVTVQGALAEGGSTRVPTMVGWVAAEWATPDEDTASGHLAVAQEFLPEVEDAWRVALESAGSGGDFTERARELGRATAEVHRVLAEVLPTEEVSSGDARSILGTSRRRLQAAVAEVPALADQQEALEAVFARAESSDWPVLQRIHGDYHLGQVLDSADRGWILLDFEGEPLRPLAERSLPDLALRDVAGMLRSFDYAGGSVEHDGGEARRWVEASRSAFLDGYAAEAGADPRDQAELLEALELDKALYEVVYEARNRPDWIDIPTAAIDRILHRSPAPGEQAAYSNEPHDTQTPSEEHVPVTPSTPPAAVPGAIAALARGHHQQPHDLLGQHPEEAGLRVRVYRPFADSVRVRFQDGEEITLEHEQDGVWTGLRAGQTQTQDYRVVVTYADGIPHEQDDPYRFAPTLGEVDRHLINEGRHEQLWTVLGAHVRSYDGPMGSVTGTSFAVWAPRAKAVHVVGDFNGWDGLAHPMRLLGDSGVWELFIPGVGEGTIYRYRILGADDVSRDKSDPMARRTECPPANASVVTHSQHVWQDEEWMTRRAETNPHTGPMSVYEVHLGSWRQGLSYRDMAEHLVNYVVDLGFTHVEFLPVMEHPFAPSWGYQVTGYFAPTARFGTPDDFRYLVDRLHQAGIGVLVDWVPAHFPKDEWALARFDGLPLYEHPDPRRGDQPDWGTHVFDFGRREVRNFLVANACYWLEEFHIDGLRVDAVASMLYLDYSRQDGQWLPNQYGGREYLEAVSLLQEANATAYKRVPGIITIAEESTSWPGVTKPTDQDGLGFGMKWNMGWMNDTLRYLAEDPVHRQYHHHLMTFALMYAYSENYILPISHDEVVHGKGSLLRKIPGSQTDQLATVRAYLAFMWAHPGKQLLFMGNEFAQPIEWADGDSLQWFLLDYPSHYRVHNMVKELNRIYRSTTAFWGLDNNPAGFEWVNADDNGGNTYTFLRFGDTERTGDVMAVVVNLGGMDRVDYRIGVPRPGDWKVVLDTSGYDEHFSPSTADTVLTAEEIPWDHQPYSIVVRVARLSTVYLQPVPQVAADDAPLAGIETDGHAEDLTDDESAVEVPDRPEGQPEQPPREPATEAAPTPPGESLMPADVERATDSRGTDGSPVALEQDPQDGSPPETEGEGPDPISQRPPR